MTRSGADPSPLPGAPRAAAPASNDRDLLRRFHESADQAAFAAIVRHHGPMVLATCRRVLHDRHGADDAFQATFLLLARQAGRTGWGDSVGGWLHLVAYRVALRAAREADRRSRREARVRDRIPAAVRDRSPDPLRNVSAREMCAALDEELSRMPARHGSVLVLCYLQGRTRDEAAAELGCPLGTLKRTLDEARKMLRTRLSRRGYGPAAAATKLAPLLAPAVVPASAPAALAKAAMGFATSLTVPSGLLTPHALTLTKGAMKTMALLKMKIAVLVLTVAAALGGAGAAFQAAARDEAVVAAPPRAKPVLPRGTLSGTVVDAGGKPLAGARVSLDDFDEAGSGVRPVAEAVSSRDGRFRLGPVDPVYRHRHHLRVEAEGFAPQYVSGGSYSIFPGEDNDLGRVRLDLGRVFSGQVVGADGRPVEGAEVEVDVWRFTADRSFNSIIAPQKLKTDGQGRYRTRPLPVGHLWLTVRAAGRQSTSVGPSAIPPSGEDVLQTVRLKEDVPVTGVVQDKNGAPVGGVKVSASNAPPATTDVSGRFVVRSYGPKPHFQVRIAQPGFAFVSQTVRGTDGGWEFFDSSARKWLEPVKDLRFTVLPVGWIEGRAVDDETGEPVLLDKVVLCYFERRAGGEIVLSGCRIPEFQQPEPGHFRLAYEEPAEYHIAATAAGYAEAEALTPKVSRLQPIGGIELRMRRLKGGDAPAARRQQMSGTVSRGGRPVKSGWVGLWRLRRPAADAVMLRGRTVACAPPIVYATAPVLDGAYTLDVPFQDDAWHVVVEEPGRPPTQVGPVRVALNERKRFDIECTAGGGVSGRVAGVPSAWAGHVWVVAFNRTGLRAEARVEPDGTFALTNLPPGEWGLKAGHDAFRDGEVPRDEAARQALQGQLADPWKRATVVEVKAGRDVESVHIGLPPE